MGMENLFTNPVTSAPLCGTLLMSLACSWIGVLLFLRKELLIGEVLSHATYPGIMLSVMLANFSSLFQGSLGVGIGAFIAGVLALMLLQFLKKCHLPEDVSQTFVLSFFFGMGILLASRLQTLYPVFYRQAQTFLYGQAATLQSVHAIFYAIIVGVVLLGIVLLYPFLKMLLFDPLFVKSNRPHVQKIHYFLIGALLLVTIMSIRSVGVVLTAGMLIAPAATARPFVKSFSAFFILSSFFGACSAFLGCAIAFKLSYAAVAMPTGPSILLVAVAFFLLAYLFSPEKGLFFRFLRKTLFRFRCSVENHLKLLWRRKSQKNCLPWWVCKWFLYKKWIFFEEETAVLTEVGRKKAERIIRLHRLWEVYLVGYMGQSIDKVHRTAEELEHLFTPELERELTEILNYPEQDPHLQPIPPSPLIEKKGKSL